MAGLLLFLVIVNSFVTGWLFAQVRTLKKTVAGVARVQREIAFDESSNRTAVVDEF